MVTLLRQYLSLWFLEICPWWLEVCLFRHGQLEMQVFRAEHVGPLLVESEPAAPSHNAVEGQLLVGVGQCGTPLA